jgi:hypothetical protein
MAEDISRNTIIVLVVLTLAVSMIGTWAVLDSITTVPSGPGQAADYGTVKFNIIKTTPQDPVTESGSVEFTIIEPN